MWKKPFEDFWQARNAQTQKQIEAGVIDAGTRGSVTGGKHLHALTVAIVDHFLSDPEIEFEAYYAGRTGLPGYYRSAKDWDVVVLYRGALVAAIELKSQVGSFGNNFNNRAEEAIGNAADIWRAYEEGHFGHIRPWLGFVMVLEKARLSTSTLKDPRALFATDPIFHQTSYLDRYRILMQRLVREKQYDAAVVAAAAKGEGTVDEPLFDLSSANFVAAIAARIAYIKALPDEAFPSAPPA